ncbi:hypothetical protein OGY18_05425 [Citrobacter sp. Cpo142]|jgi:O-antigen/teichoic acid export membrane protein|uniref:hypothetical protein n=1 Tax=Citrobacter TaxID=544 RepID=UPI0025773A9A|nr:hypothetical protein [Citrobacter sp. Cpo142]MDM2776597.1 hypothetical protein [Citrobacter sp. Cpo142]
MIIKTAFWAMSQTLAKLIAGFIIIKLIAKVGGPDALSNFGLYQNLVTVLLMVSGGVMFAGVTSKIARAENNDEFTRFYTGANIFLNRLLLISFFVFFPLCIFILYVTVDWMRGNIIALLLLSLPFILLQTRFNFYLAVLNGLSKVNLLARDNIYASILTILIACVAFFITTDWRYFAICMCLGPTLRYIYVVGRNKQEYKLSENIKPEKDLRYLLRYSLVGLISSLCLPIAQIIARNFITNHNGLFESGIWQGLTRFSEVYLVLVSSVLSVYVLPKISPAKNRIQIKECILPLIILLIPLIGIGVLFIYCLKEYVVIILFSREFLPMQDLFIYQLPGDIFKIFAWVLTFSLLGLGKTKTLIFLELAYFCTYLALVYFAVPIYGVKGAVVAYSASYLLYLFLTIAVFVYWYKKYDK